MLATDDVYDLIDTYGTNLKRWPDEVRKDALNMIESDRDLQAYYENEQLLDKQLAHWKDNDDAASVRDDEADRADDEDDEDGTVGSEREGGEGDESGEGSTSGEGEGEGEPIDGDLEGPPVDAEGEASEVPEDIATAFSDQGSMEDMDGAMAEIIKSMVMKVLPKQDFLEYTRDYDLTALAPVVPGVEIGDMEKRVERVSASMQKDLQRIITARSLSHYVPGFRRGRINNSSLHRLETGDDRVFRRKQTNTTNDVAVSLIVDCSGSMGGRRFQLAMDSAWAFAAVLDRLNIECEVVGFTTRGESYGYGDMSSPELAGIDKVHSGAANLAHELGVSVDSVRWEALYHPIFKSFGERFGMEQKRRFVSAVEHRTVQLIQNIDGASIMEIAKRLILRKEARKLMIVFSDGEPCSHMDSRVLASHLKKVVKKISKSGVDVIGVGIQTESVKRFYDKAFVVRNLEELPKLVIGELKRFLTS